jgi:hypothetical protein
MKAFPSENDSNKQYNYLEKGMDLRDYFAAKAMMIVLKEWSDECGEIPYLDESGEPMTYEEGSIGTWFPHTIFFGKSCYAIADAMMEARNATK